MIANVLTIAVMAANLAALRAAASGGFQALNVAVCTLSTGNSAIYRWAPAALGADDGISTIKPNDIAAQNAGRWLLVDWAELEAEGFHGELLISIALSAVNSRFVFQVGNDWTLIGMTEDAGVRRVWFKKTITVPS